MTGEEKETVEKRERDPIVWACLIVLLLASVSVLGVYVYDHGISNGPAAVDGNKVEVDYIGTLYAPYGEEGYAVFDTSFFSVANDENVLKTNSFDLKKESAYNALEVTIGNGSLLKDFENALIGMHAGQTKEIKISAENGYVANVCNYETYNADHAFTVPLADKMPLAAFEELYELDNFEVTAYELTSPYGWKVDATLDKATNSVCLAYDVKVGETYVVSDDGLGKLTTTVKSINNGVISYTYNVEKFNKTADGIMLLEIYNGSKMLYISDVEENNGKVTSYTVKDVAKPSDATTSSEIYNEVLYFKITLKSFVKEEKK